MFEPAIEIGPRQRGAVEQTSAISKEDLVLIDIAGKHRDIAMMAIHAGVP